MAEPPVLKNWKMLVEEQLEKTGHNEVDILKTIHACQDYLGEIQPIARWIGQQQSFVTQIHRIFSDMYFTMFDKQPPPRPKEAPITEILLDTPERRKQAIREVALSITKPRDEVSDEAILEELKHRAMKIDAYNPTATISTIMLGFKPQFEKVQGKRGVFRRQQ
jgi:hypothetical protein